jgi:cobalt-zinc-cadmium efflux system outer membrane protein
VKPGETEAEAVAEALAGGPTNDQIAGPMRRVIGRAGEEPNKRPEVTKGPPAESEQRFGWIERAVLEHNLHVAALRELIDAQAGRLKLDTTLAVFPFINLNFTSEYTTADEWGLGPSIDIPIPIWDHGQAQKVQETARLRQRIEEYAATAVDVRAAARAAEVRLQTTRSRAIYMRDVVLPLHAALVAEAQLQYNAMQVTPFQLIRAKMRQIAAGQQHVVALLEYWTARTDLEQLLDGSLPPGVIGHRVAGAGGGMMVAPLTGM